MFWRKITSSPYLLGGYILTIGSEIAARIKRNRKTQQIKFKVRCNRFLYSLVLKDSDKADKLKQSLPPCAYLPTIPFYRPRVYNSDLKMEFDADVIR